MKRTVKITESKEVEVEVPAFFKTYCHYYMSKENGRFTQVFLGFNNSESAQINDVAEAVAFSDSQCDVKPLDAITMEEFYSKLNEAFNILSIGSHELKEAADNNFSQAAHEDLLQAHGHESAEFSC